MPHYTYRREDGSTFDIRQSFSDAALTQDPLTGQKVIRLVQSPSVIFKGSGFYVNDSKGASKSNGVTSSKESKDTSETTKSTAEAKPSESTKSEAGKSDASPAKSSTPAPSAAAD